MYWEHQWLEFGLIFFTKGKKKKKKAEDTEKQKHSFRHFNNEKYQPILALQFPEKKFLVFISGEHRFHLKLICV